MKAFIVLTLLVAVAAAQLQVQVPQGPAVQVQFPGRQPQQPPPMWQQPEPPMRPNVPRADWRAGEPDSRCPNPDNHQGFAVFVTDPNNPSGFRICWGQRSWPFDCPPGTTWWNERSTCAFQSQIDAGRNQWIPPQFPNLRPFDSDNAPFAEDVADE